MKPDLNRSFEQTVKEFQMIKREETVIVGVSGGADSVCLLFLLSEFRKKVPFALRAVHLNHRIRGEEARRDGQFVKLLCEKLQVPLTLKSMDVPLLAKKWKMSEEEAGREARYQIFFETAKETGGKIAVAHHREDNAETVLLNLIRGSGIRGLSGMSPVSERSGVTILRPLLFQSREEIERFLKENRIPFCEDRTNLDPAYARNAVRLKILPELKRLNGQAVRHISQTAGMLREIEDFLERETEKAFQETVFDREGETVLRIVPLLEKETVIQKRVVLRAAAQAAGSRKDLSSRHVSAILKLASLQSGRSTDLPYGLSARRQYDEICIRKTENLPRRMTGQILKTEIGEEEKKVSLENGMTLFFRKVPVHNGNRVRLMEKNLYTKAFDYDKIKKLVKMGEKLPGDVIELKVGRKTLKKLFQDEKIPAEQRKRILVLKDEESVIWVVGSRISHRHKITDDTKTALIIRTEKGEVGREY